MLPPSFIARAGSKSTCVGAARATKLWVNGELVGQSPRSTILAIRSISTNRTSTLRSGRNVILLKICQNEQTQTWAQDWDFQFRVCDAIGTAILRHKHSLEP